MSFAAILVLNFMNKQEKRRGPRKLHSDELNNEYIS